MESLELKEWLAINSVIYKIYAHQDFEQMRVEFLEHLKLFIDFDGACFYLADSQKDMRMEHPVTLNCETPEQLEIGEENYLYQIMQRRNNIVFRETDMIEEQKWVQTSVYQSFFLPNNWHYCMRLILTMDKKILGMITLFRYMSKKNFDSNDVMMLDLFKEHLALVVGQKNDFLKKGQSDCEEFEKTIEKYGLTKKEKVVLELLSKGESVEKISDLLKVSVNTVKKHTVNIYKKLGINKRIQLFQMFSNG